jgi:hypothetical protein
LYRPIWLDDPVVAFRGSRRDTRLTVFQATCPPRGRNHAAPLMRLRPLQGQPKHSPPAHPGPSATRWERSKQAPTILLSHRRQRFCHSPSWLKQAPTILSSHRRQRFCHSPSWSKQAPTILSSHRRQRSCHSPSWSKQAPTILLSHWRPGDLATPMEFLAPSTRKHG